MQTQAHEINEVVGLPLDHSFGADYLQRFPIASDLPRPRDVFDWLSRTRLLAMGRHGRSESPTRLCERQTDPPRCPRCD